MKKIVITLFIVVALIIVYVLTTIYYWDKGDREFYALMRERSVVNKPVVDKELAQQQWGEVTNGLQCAIMRIDNKPVSLGDKLPQLLLSIRNTTDEDVIIHGETFDQTQQTVSGGITHPDGEKIGYFMRMPPAFKNLLDMEPQTMTPHSSISGVIKGAWDFNLGRYPNCIPFVASVKGKYHIQVIWRGAKGHGKYDYWQGTLKSNIVSFEVQSVSEKNKDKFEKK